LLLLRLKLTLYTILFHIKTQELVIDIVSYNLYNNYMNSKRARGPVRERYSPEERQYTPRIKKDLEDSLGFKEVVPRTPLAVMPSVIRVEQQAFKRDLSKKWKNVAIGALMLGAASLLAGHNEIEDVISSHSTSAPYVTPPCNGTEGTHAVYLPFPSSGPNLGDESLATFVHDLENPRLGDVKNAATCSLSGLLNYVNRLNNSLTIGDDHVTTGVPPINGVVAVNLPYAVKP
jgi:hypothetical protein